MRSVCKQFQLLPYHRLSSREDAVAALDDERPAAWLSRPVGYLSDFGRYLGTADGSEKHRLAI